MQISKTKAIVPADGYLGQCKYFFLIDATIIIAVKQYEHVSLTVATRNAALISDRNLIVDLEVFSSEFVRLELSFLTKAICSVKSMRLLPSK